MKRFALGFALLACVGWFWLPPREFAFLKGAHPQVREDIDGQGRRYIELRFDRSSLQTAKFLDRHLTVRSGWRRKVMIHLGAKTWMQGSYNHYERGQGAGLDAIDVYPRQPGSIVILSGKRLIAAFKTL